MTPVYVVAPAACAFGMYVTPTCCFALVGHPNAQTPLPAQPRTLRSTKPPDHPSASAPRRATCALGPASSGGTRTTLSSRSTRSKCGARSRSSPNSSRQRASTRSGVRKHVPEFTSVVPPTAFPSGSRIGGRPIVACWAASRYSRGSMSRGRAVNSAASCATPSSTITTRAPASASSLATTAPPAPDPITATSACTVRRPEKPERSTTPPAGETAAGGAASGGVAFAARNTSPRRTRSAAS